MPKSKFFALILVVSILILVSQQLISFFNTREAQTEFSHYHVPLLSSITIQSLDKRLELNNGPGWTINGLPVKKAAIKRIQTQLKQLSERQLVSTRASKHSRFQVQSDSVTLQTKEGDSLRFFIGKAGPDSGSFYLRFSESDDTFLVQQALPAIYSFSESYWTDTTACSLDPSAVTSMIFMSEKITISYHKKDTTWYQSLNGQDNEIPTETMEYFASLFSNLNASEVSLIRNVSFNKDSSDMKINITAGPTLYSLQFYLIENSDYYVTNSTMPDYVYLIEGVIFKELLQSMAD